MNRGIIIPIAAAAVGYFLAGPALDGYLSTMPSMNFITGISHGTEAVTAIAFALAAHLIVR